MMKTMMKEMVMTTTLVAAMLAVDPVTAKEPLSSGDAFNRALSIKREVDEIRFRILDVKAANPSVDVSEDEARLEEARQALKSADDELLAARRREGLPVDGIVGILPDSLPPIRIRK